MKEFPILFKAEMVRAILGNRKFQTRRIVKWKKPDAGLNMQFSGLQSGFYCTDAPASGWVLRSRDGGGCWNDRTERTYCPYGVVGDKLWVRETWAYAPDGYVYRADYLDGGDAQGVVDFRTGNVIPLIWKPSIFMPRAASRIQLEVLNVRVERVHSISELDALAEGVTPAIAGVMEGWEHRFAYRDLWNKINSKSGVDWDTNPWTWVIEFKRSNYSKISSS
jgi:hypothetical protein